MQYFTYSSEQVEFADFSEWLTEFESSKLFQMKKEKFIEINKRLLHEGDTEMRGYLLSQIRQL